MGKKIKAIIFDADGVVIKPRSEYFSTRYAKENNVDNQKIQTFFKTTFQKCLIDENDLKKELDHILPTWDWKKGAEKFMDLWFKSENNPDDSVIKYAVQLQEKGFKIFIATNNEKYRTQYIREKMGFELIFDKIYSSGEIKVMKPDIKFYKLILDENKFLPEEVIFVDDDQVNIDGAINAGLHSILFENLQQLKSEIKIFY